MRLLLALALATSGCVCFRPTDEVQQALPPVAVIDPADVNVNAGVPVTLDGSASYSKYSTPLSWSWRLRSRPTASTLVLTGAQSPSLTVTPDVDGAYVVELIVSASGVASAPAFATINAAKMGAVVIANAGPDQTVQVGAAVMLTGIGSRAPNFSALYFEWAFTQRPTLSTAMLSGALGLQPRFMADVEGTYDVRLEVRAEDGQTSTDTVRITAVSPSNREPTARLSALQQVTPNTVVRLDGSASSDPDGDPLSFSWRVVSQPQGAAVSLVGANGQQQSITLRVAGPHVFELKVSDPKGLSATALATVTVTQTPSAIDGGHGGTISDVFDPDEIYIAGTLAEGACYRDAMAHWSTPNVPASGFDCYFDNRTATIRPTDGRLLYTNTFEDLLREFRCDSCPTPPGNSYPTNVLANDPILPTPCGPNEPAEAWAFRVSPQGSVLHQCHGQQNAWRDSTGMVVYDEGAGALVAFGHAGVMLTNTAVVHPGMAMGLPIVGLPSRSWVTSRARIDGFWVAIAAANPTDAATLWKVDFMGMATKVADYAPLPANTRGGYSGRLDGHGALFEMGDDTTVVFRDVIIRRTLMGASDVVYSEASNPRVKLHISDLVTGP